MNSPDSHSLAGRVGGSNSFARTGRAIHAAPRVRRTRRFFLSALGLTAFVAVVSYWWQYPGLAGPNGTNWSFTSAAAVTPKPTLMACDRERLKTALGKAPSGSHKTYTVGTPHNRNNP